MSSALIGEAVRLTALVTLAAGVLVLGGAIAAGHRRRVYDAVVLKVLGATRGAIAGAFLIEYGSWACWPRSSPARSAPWRPISRSPG